MALHQFTGNNVRLFSGYGDGFVAVNGQVYRQSIIVSPASVRTDWVVAGFSALTQENFQVLLELKSEILLLGTGARQHFARPELYRDLIKAGIGVEFMDTPAACRTYNILAAEDRNVAAAILL